MPTEKIWFKLFQSKVEGGLANFFHIINGKNILMTFGLYLCFCLGGRALKYHHAEVFAKFSLILLIGVSEFTQGHGMLQVISEYI